MDICHCLTGLIGSWEFNALSLLPTLMWPCWHLHTTPPHYLQPITDAEQWAFHRVLPVNWKIEAMSKLTPHCAQHLCANLPTMYCSQKFYDLMKTAQLFPWHVHVLLLHLSQMRQLQLRSSTAVSDDTKRQWLVSVWNLQSPLVAE